jgi:hypothetical protein
VRSDFARQFSADCRCAAGAGGALVCLARLRRTDIRPWDTRLRGQHSSGRTSVPPVGDASLTNAKLRLLHVAPSAPAQVSERQAGDH